MNETGAKGLQLIKILSGGSANNGQEVYFEALVFDGEEEHKLMFFCDAGIIPIWITHLDNYAGMSAQVRRVQNPAEEKPGTVTGSHVHLVKSVSTGSSLDGQTKILRVHTTQDMSLDLALSLERLRELSAQIEHLLTAADQDAKPVNKLN